MVFFSQQRQAMRLARRGTKKKKQSEEGTPNKFGNKKNLNVLSKLSNGQRHF